MLIFYYFKAHFGAYGVLIGQNNFKIGQSVLKSGYKRIFVENIKICVQVINKDESTLFPSSSVSKLTFAIFGHLVVNTFEMQV